VVSRVLVGAHYGLKDWLAQRVTAVAMLAYTLVFALVFLLALGRGPLTYATWKALFAQGWMRAATFVFVASVLIHAWIGMRNIFMDYVHHTGLRLALQIATILWLVACAGWAMQILWRI
jgi:succinate dehydrogenase / fumarate reductase membrane anchor subunit